MVTGPINEIDKIPPAEAEQRNQAAASLPELLALLSDLLSFGFFDVMLEVSQAAISKNESANTANIVTLRIGMSLAQVGDKH